MTWISWHIQSCNSREQGDNCAVLVWYRLIKGWSGIFESTLSSSKFVFRISILNCDLTIFDIHLTFICISLQHIIYIPQPTWGNHPKVFTLAGLSVKTYRYYDPTTRGLNIQGTFYFDLQIWESLIVPFIAACSLELYCTFFFSCVQDLQMGLCFL